jgi:hypothetical protein
MAEPNTSIAAGHELSDVPVRPVVLIGSAIWLVVALVFALCLVVFRVFIGPGPIPGEVEPFPPAPRLEVAPAAEYQQLRSEEDRKLSSYGWVDRKAGKVRIPIERAIDLQLERGFPARKEGTNK